MKYSLKEDKHTRSELHMNLHTVKPFRQPVSDCMKQQADALSGLCDSLLSESQARSWPELVHSLFFERHRPGISAAQVAEKSTLDERRMRCIQSMLEELSAEEVVWITVDATPGERPEAHTSEDRSSPFTARTCLWLIALPVSSGCSRQKGCCPNGRATALLCWMFNTSIGSRQQWEWQLNSFDNSSRSVGHGQLSWPPITGVGLPAGSQPVEKRATAW
jgi:hypothetical protein